MAGAAELSREDVLHVVFRDTAFRAEDLGMAEFASVNVGVDLVREDDVGHAEDR